MPGEKMRTPLVAFVRYDGRDIDRATNLWRRWLIDCNLRKVTDDAQEGAEKHLFEPQVSGGTSVLYHEMTQATDANQIAAIQWYIENDIDIKMCIRDRTISVQLLIFHGVLLSVKFCTLQQNSLF